jgi:flagellin
MSQANRNAQDANNLLATAESGLSDISDILSKMRELSVQAATDTLNDNDRSSIELEFQSLKDEITRIANVTEYNGMNVLNGTYQDNSNTGTDSVETWDGDGPKSLFDANSSTSNPGVLDAYDQHQPGTASGISGLTSSSEPHGQTGPAEINENGPSDDYRGHWRLQIGADNDINNQHEFSIMNATANGLDLHGREALDSSDVNVRTVDGARDAVTRLDHAIDEVNRERSYIGSEQNKLQFTMSNLTSNIQSIESSRSSIEDVDFAAEAADLAKNQILAQSGTAMLAQASAISQNILGLLA